VKENGQPAEIGCAAMPNGASFSICHSNAASVGVLAGGFGVRDGGFGKVRLDDEAECAAYRLPNFLG
jgi:hypothetical protein